MILRLILVALYFLTMATALLAPRRVRVGLIRLGDAGWMLMTVICGVLIALMKDGTYGHQLTRLFIGGVILTIGLKGAIEFNGTLLRGISYILIVAGMILAVVGGVTTGIAWAHNLLRSPDGYTTEIVRNVELAELTEVFGGKYEPGTYVLEQKDCYFVYPKQETATDERPQPIVLRATKVIISAPRDNTPRYIEYRLVSYYVWGNEVRFDDEYLFRYTLSVRNDEILRGK